MPRLHANVLLVVAWAVSMALAVVCAGVFAAGVARDNRAGEPTLEMSFSMPGDWSRVPFRVRRAGTYRLFVSTVNHDPQRVGAPFSGQLEVMISRPDGTPFYSGRFEGAAIRHTVPDNYGDAELARVDLDASLAGTWILAVRVAEPSPAFAGLRSQVKLWREREDPGMGGLINYVMIVPATLFAMLGLLLALPLARRGIYWPILASGAALVVGLIWSRF
jgi:hypothetical protein